VSGVVPVTSGCPHEVLAETKPCRRNLKRACVEVDVTPAQTGHLAAAQSGKRELPRDRVPVAVDVIEDLLQLRGCECIRGLRVRRDAVDELGDVTHHVALSRSTAVSRPSM
jgi:hypothetical protein